MKRLMTPFLAFALMSCAAAPSIELKPAITGNYVLDPAHASVTWSISHVGLSNFTARFDDITGTLRFDADAPKNSVVDIRIDPKSVNTGLPTFDETIANDSRYFNAEKYPEIRFLSTAITVTGEAKANITGDLAFRGETRPVTLDVTFNGAGSSFGHLGQTLGFSAKGEINRSEYGLTYLKNFGIGEIVSLKIEAEFNEAK